MGSYLRALLSSFEDRYLQPKLQVVLIGLLKLSLPPLSLHRVVHCYRLIIVCRGWPWEHYLRLSIDWVISLICVLMFLHNMIDNVGLKRCPASLCFFDAFSLILGTFWMCVQPLCHECCKTCLLVLVVFFLHLFLLLVFLLSRSPIYQMSFHSIDFAD